MPPTDLRLSRHFRLSEFTLSQKAARLRLDNTPSAAQIRNLARVADRLERARAILIAAANASSKAKVVDDIPIFISSGFRAPQLNRAVGGARYSAHLDGLAADFTAPKFGTPREICCALRDSDLSFDQLIFEGTWVHLGLAPEAKPESREVLTAVFWPNAPTRYVKGVV